jgi:AcrR family transcriptional regulator
MARLETAGRRRDRVRAGGRSERVRIQVARACLDLLGEGRIEFGRGEIAERAGVSRATLNRWWPTKDDLLREALSLHTARLEVPDTGAWATDVQALIDQLAAFFADPVEVSQNALMAAGRHPGYNEIVLQHYGYLFAEWRGVVERAVDRGEVRPDVDADTVIMLLASPLVVAPMLFHQELPAGALSHMAELVVAATST